MVISLPSSERIYARSCPEQMSKKPRQSADPLWMTVPLLMSWQTADPESADRCCAVSCSHIGKYLEISISAAPPKRFHYRIRADICQLSARRHLDSLTQNTPMQKFLYDHLFLTV